MLVKDQFFSGGDNFLALKQKSSSLALTTMTMHYSDYCIDYISDIKIEEPYTRADNIGRRTNFRDTSPVYQDQSSLEINSR